MAELRRDPRLRCALVAVFEGPRGAVRGTCTNVSVGGLFFEGNQLPVGSNADVTLELPHGGRLRLHCQIRHHATTPKGMGAQFTRFEPGQVEVLQRLLETLTR